MNLNVGIEITIPGINPGIPKFNKKKILFYYINFFIIYIVKNCYYKLQL